MATGAKGQAEEKMSYPTKRQAIIDKYRPVCYSVPN